MGALILSVLAVVGPTLPQQPPPGDRVHPIVGPVRDAGILHVATNTWARRAATIGLGTQVIYDNTCDPQSYSALSGDTFVDEGRLPSATSPTNGESRPGCATQYTIDGFQIAYCTDFPTPVQFEIAFHASYSACSSVIGTTPTATFVPAGLPGHISGPFPTCWIVTVDLESSSQGFTMAADGDGSYAGAPADNLFGWSIRSTMPAGMQIATGPILAGDVSLCSRFDGTRWDSPVNYFERGTGMGTVDGIRIESGRTPPGCIAYPGEFTSLHLELYSDACEPPFDRNAFCFGDGTGTPCPCGNHSPVPGTGCLHSFGIGARLGRQGFASISSDSLVLLGDQMPPNAPVLYYQGTLQQSAGAGATFGDGKRCAGGPVIRLGTSANSATGTSLYPRPGDPSVSVRGHLTSPATRTYQAWYRNAASFCTSATFNLTNGLQVFWDA